MAEKENKSPELIKFKSDKLYTYNSFSGIDMYIEEPSYSIRCIRFVYDRKENLVRGSFNSSSQ